MLASLFQTAADLLAPYLSTDPRALPLWVAALVVVPFVLSAVPHAINRSRKEG